jgi:site-specific DNA recombinase
MAWRAGQGLWNGGQVIGYDLIDKKLVINKKEAKIVKLMYTKYLELGSSLQTALWLNNQGYRTKEYIAGRSNVKHGGKKFTNSMIIQKLKSHVYIGDVGLKDKYFKGQHESIIDRDLWKQVNEVIAKQAPTRRNPKQPKQHTFILQGLLECGWCGSFMTSKYCTGRGGKLHYYYQCTKNAHGGKDGCEMKYVPANKLEKIALDKIRLLSVDNDFLNQIVLKANESVNDELVILNETKKDHENKLLPLKDQIDNLVTAIANKQIGDYKSISEKLGKLEEQKDQLEKAIEGLTYQINEKRQKVFDAEIMHKSLTKFSQVYDKALPEEIKELLPYFVDQITFKPDEIKIALFDQPVEKGLFVNHSGDGAPECIEWLPREGSNLGHTGYDLTYLTTGVGLSLRPVL